MKHTKIKIHPLTIKSLQRGHPWITLDNFSEKFPKDKQLIEIYDPSSNKLLGTFINDKKHPKVKARLWSKNHTKNLSTEIKSRLQESISKRNNSNFNRDNYYLVFAEADHMPGLFIQKLKNHILIQYQSYFWIEFEDLIKKELTKTYPNSFFWSQKRITGEQKKAPKALAEGQETNFFIEEFNIKYKLDLATYHDIGIFTDMSAIRDKINKYFKNANNVLNLFCYTGAFSLYALKNNSRVTSVDLSKKYILWLEENIKLNNFDQTKHTSLVKSCQKQIDHFLENNEKFDLIICDPPTVSTDGKKRMKATDFYKSYLDKMISLLNNNGRGIFVLNTHNINQKKFKDLILKSTNQRVSIEEQLQLNLDCKPLPNFPEGDYLKCLILKRLK